ncbi:8204_t:CDS:2 [Rhizophagus irregularis]|nr:8204_t:CDS:2 [Rhizophagus irregularis]
MLNSIITTYNKFDEQQKKSMNPKKKKRKIVPFHGMFLFEAVECFFGPEKALAPFDETYYPDDWEASEPYDPFGKPDVLNLWQIDVYESKLNPNSTEDDIKNLGELEKKRPFTEVEEKANRIVQRAGVYFVDPLELSEPLLNNIRKGEFMTLHGVRATGKTTRVFRVMEQFEEEGYLCLFFSFKRSQVPDSKILFWTTFSDYLVRTAPEHIEDQIKSSNDFVNLFSKRWEKKVILFIDEYDIMYRANNETISSFLRIVRNIKARKEGYAIWSINIVDPSILHLSSKEVTTSPFNVYRPFQNPNFTQEQVQFLFKEYANEERIIINQEVIKDIYMRTNGHAGWPCHQLRKSYR